MANQPTEADYQGLSAIQDYCWQTAEEKGFHAEGDYFRLAAEGPDAHPYDLKALDNYYAKRLFLIVTEPVEAFDELRSGHGMTEQYTNAEKVGKPEGVVSEIIDTIVRSLDLLRELEVDVSEAFIGKTDYNSTREFMHGRKF